MIVLYIEYIGYFEVLLTKKNDLYYNQSFVITYKINLKKNG